MKAQTSNISAPNFHSVASIKRFIYCGYKNINVHSKTWRSQAAFLLLHTESMVVKRKVLLQKGMLLGLNSQTFPGIALFF